jgi:hypothetical protein
MPNVILDLDASVLAHATQDLKGIFAVQGDIRSLPFKNRFERVLVAGCVTAYLLDDSEVKRTATSIASALRKRFSTTLWMDAYDSERILDIDYFNCEREVTLLAQPWTLIARSIQVKSQPCLFDVILSFIPHHLTGTPTRFEFRQRAFRVVELESIFQSSGFEIHSSETHAETGRHSLRFSLKEQLPITYQC